MDSDDPGRQGLLPVDKEAGDQFAQSRYFIARVVRYLAGEAGIAQRVAPDSRVVYVDNDPLVLAHAQASPGKRYAVFGQERS